MGVIKEIKDYVKQLTISELVSSSSSDIYLNLTTLEGDKYTVRLSERGFSIVACELDSVQLEGWDLIVCPKNNFYRPYKRSLHRETVYETPHSLLDNISAAYRQVHTYICVSWQWKIWTRQYFPHRPMSSNDRLLVTTWQPNWLSWRRDERVKQKLIILSQNENKSRLYEFSLYLSREIMVLLFHIILHLFNRCPFHQGIGDPL